MEDGEKNTLERGQHDVRMQHWFGVNDQATGARQSSSCFHKRATSKLHPMICSTTFVFPNAPSKKRLGQMYPDASRNPHLRPLECSTLGACGRPGALSANFSSGH